MGVVPLYAGILGMIFAGLALRVARLRRDCDTPLGDGRDVVLQRAIRAHANFSEYVPLSLVLLAMMDLQHFPTMLLHALSATLVFGRCLHAYGISQIDEDYRLRSIALAANLTVIMVAALFLVSDFVTGRRL
jgi:hypothetical protein